MIEQKQLIKLEDLFKKDKIQFWKEVKNVQNNKTVVNININELKNEFKKQFNEKLFVNKDTEKIANENYHKFNEEFQNKIFDYKISLYKLDNILKELPNGKSRGFSEVQSEMFKYGRNSILIKIIVNIIQTMINYGITPHHFNIGIIKPIVKDTKKTADDSKNLRPVTISDTFANRYEKVILCEIEKTHTDDAKQFGFKKHSSCSHAVFTVNETIKYKLKDNKKLFICAIDASKAFDKVDRKYLWMKLENKVEPHILRSLINYYSDSMAIVQNDGEYSDIFNTTIGVKQGGPLSPKLFSMYVEDLIKEVETSSEGATLGKIKIDIIMYADDILLISEKKSGLDKLLSITELFGKKWEIKFNPSKTVYMEFGNKERKNNNFLLRKKNPVFDGKEIIKVDKMKYLGMFYDNKLSNKDHLNKKRTATFAAINKIQSLGIEKKITTSKMKSCLYKTYCRPILYYGLENLKLTEIEIKKLQTTESNIIKRSLGLSNRILSTKLIYSMGLEKSLNRLQKTKIYFFKRLIGNKYTKKVVGAIIEEFKNDQNKVNPKSIIAEIKKITQATEWSIDQLLEKGKSKLLEIDNDTQSQINSSEKIQKILLKNEPERSEQLKIELSAF